MKIRLPAELKQAIEDMAEYNQRSMNAEIVARLYQTFEYQGIPSVRLNFPNVQLDVAHTEIHEDVENSPVVKAIGTIYERAIKRALSEVGLEIQRLQDEKSTRPADDEPEK